MSNEYIKCIQNTYFWKCGKQELQHRGRIRVQLKNDDGTPFNADFDSRDKLLEHVGTMIPQLKSRQSGRSSDNSQAQQPSSSGGNKKGKGKRR